MRKYSGETFLKIADVKDGPITEQIAVVKMGKFDKPVLVCETGNALSVNATNNSTLVRAYGRNSNDWIDKTIELYLGEVEFQERPMEAVLVRPISPPVPAEQRTKLPPAQPSKPDFDDPFKLS